MGAAVVASAVGAAAGVWGFEEPQAPRASVVAATRAEAVRVRRVMIMNLTVRDNTRGARCSSDHLKPRNLKDVRGILKATQGVIRVSPGSLSVQDKGARFAVLGWGLVPTWSRVQAVA